jgi:hypothetical protein
MKKGGKENLGIKKETKKEQKKSENLTTNRRETDETAQSV